MSRSIHLATRVARFLLFFFGAMHLIVAIYLVVDGNVGADFVSHAQVAVSAYAYGFAVTAATEEGRAVPDRIRRARRTLLGLLCLSVVESLLVAAVCLLQGIRFTVGISYGGGFLDTTALRYLMGETSTAVYMPALYLDMPLVTMVLLLWALEGAMTRTRTK